MDPTEDDNPLVKLTSLAVLGLGLGALFLGYGNFWLIFALGFAVLVPMVKLATEEFGVGEDAGDRENRATGTQRSGDSTARGNAAGASDESAQDALDTLRGRYARGDLTEAEFERKVEALLETETPESARQRIERDRTRGAEESGLADERAK